MGILGTGIFSDDLAADIRGDFRDLIGDGRTPAEATTILCTEYKESISDHDEGTVFWLALAATQWKLGRLEESVSTEALSIIDGGKDLHRWRDEPKLLRKREAVLEELRQQLLSRPPPPKKIPKVIKNANEWDAGEIVSYTLLSGRKVCFRVVGHHTDKGGRFAVCEILDWIGETIPAVPQLSEIPVRMSLKRPSLSQFMLSNPHATHKQAKRFCRTGIRIAPAKRPGGYTVFPWQYLDKMLKGHFDLD